MSSLLSGFEYDIFISYRHNDNRSGWVTEFVKALQEELSSTIKEPVSVYFDTNPHDGLLETHNVDKSLEGKLKCLIFIPIISQTYCDPKSFAWQHEFVVFNKMSNSDKFGRDIKVGNGNVASRILPVKIHDLDGDDLAIIENELSGALRPIDFIYRSAGVNRPLTAADNPEKNLASTFYRDQINKVANGVKEILTGLKHFENPPVASKSKTYPVQKKKIDFGKVLKIGIISFLLVLITGYFLFNLVGMIALPHKDQLPQHKLIYPIFVLTVVIFVSRQPIRKMGFTLMHISAASVFMGGLLDIFFTLTSTSLPLQHAEFLHINQVDISSDLVKLEFLLIRTIGTAKMAVGIGCWFMLKSLGKQRNKSILIAFALMVTLTEGDNSVAMYTLALPFYIYTATTVLIAWIGAVLWWNGPPYEATSLT